MLGLLGKGNYFCYKVSDFILISTWDYLYWMF